MNLVTTTLATCRGQLVWALNLAYQAGSKYKPASDEGSKIPKDLAKKAIEVLDEVGKHLPKDHVLPALPIDTKELLRQVDEEAKK